MELRHIRYFLAVAEEMNFTRAAEKLCIAQPPLSRQIQDLEYELGAKLFIRKPHSLALTEEGMLFRQYAMQVLNLVEKSAEDIRDMTRGLQGILYLASVEGHGPHLYSEWIVGMHQKYPDVQYNLWNGNSDDVAGRVSKGLSELGIITEPYNAEGLEAIRIYEEPWVAMMPLDHPLASLPGDCISFRDLADYDLIIPSRHSRLKEVQEWFASSGVTPRIRCRIAHTLSAYELTRQGVGVAIYPASITDIAARDTICTKMLTDPEVKVSYVLIWSKERTLSKVAKAFVDYVRENYLER